TERILVVDDEASLVKLLKRMLEAQGYEVVGETNSTKALKLFQKESNNFALVITDMAMPKMPGDRLVKELIKINPTLPIIVCTGHSDRMDEYAANELGIKEYHMKPFVREDLIKAVRRILDDAKGTAQG
ncbi:MAG: response regulator, partial [Pseudomonadota bacterium]